MQEETSPRDALAVINAAELPGLKELADGPGLACLAIHAGLLVLSGSAIMLASPLLLAPALVAHGILVVFLFTAEHEAIHGTAFRSAWINTAVAEAAGFLLLLPPRYFQYFHFAHHRHTQRPGSDPELAAPKPSDWPSYLLYLSGLPYWRAEVTVLIRNALGGALPTYVPAGAAHRLRTEARAHLSAIALLAAASLWFGWTWPLWLWVIPALLGQPFLRAFLLAEHAACPFVADMLANSRTTFANGVVNLIAWNMPHHTAHHALPVVPFHRLPRLTGLLATRIGVKAEGYPDAHRQIRRAWMR